MHNYRSGSTPSGENVVVDTERDALSKAGHEVQVVRLDNDVMNQRPFNGIRAGLTVATGLGPSPLDSLEGQPDVLHVHNLFPHFGNRWASRTGIPIVTTLHNYRPICANGNLFRDGRVCTLCLDGKRWSGVRYGCYRHSALASLPPAFSNQVSADPVLQAARRNLVLSERARQVFLKAGLPESKLERSWHFVPKGLVGEPSDRHGDFWLCVGRMMPEKGVDRLVAEWPAGLPLVVVGDGPRRAAVEAAAVGKRVTVLGSLSREEVVEMMSRAFGLVVPSLWYETFGLTYIEALSAGLPVLAFPPNVIAERVEEEGTGVVAEWGSVRAALEIAQESFHGLRTRCREVFDERYTESSWLARRIELYERVAQ